MEQAVRDLVVTPFEEIVAKAKVAAANANTNVDNAPPPPTQMHKAAQSLVREGERALRKIAPLCEKHLEAYGANFLDELKGNGQIAAFRNELNDLLWEFDDYIEAEDFDADKFAELQAHSRRAAPKIVEILMCMKLEPAPKAPEPEPAVASSPAPAPPSKEGEETSTATETATDDGRRGREQARTLMGAKSGPDLGLSGNDGGEAATTERRTSRDSDITQAAAIPDSIPEEPEDLPDEPDIDPWIIGPAPTLPGLLDGSATDDAGEVVRRRPAASRPDSPTLPFSHAAAVATNGHRGRRDSLAEAAAVAAAAGRRVSRDRGRGRRASSAQNGGGCGGGGRYVVSPLIRPMDAPSPQSPNGQLYSLNQAHDMTHQGPSWAANGQQQHPHHHQQQVRERVWPSDSSSRYSLTSSYAESSQSSVFDTGHYNGNPDRHTMSSTVSPVMSPGKVSVGSPAADLKMSASFGRFPPDLSMPSPALNPTEPLSPPPDIPADLEAVPSNGGVEVDQGLIPVESGESESSVVPPAGAAARELDCSITPKSSFHQMKGFCEGALEVQAGGMGVKQVRKLTFGGGSTIAAKCKHCMYELEWKQVEADKLGHNSANYVSQDIGFRLRVLSKCHLPSKSVEDQAYACPFCLARGRTTEASDPTVFFSQRALFAHFGRHARPLPPVPYLTVIDGPEVPARFRNDYDLYFLTPDPVRSVMEGLGRELGMLPAATAVETFRKSAGGGGGGGGGGGSGGGKSNIRLPPDRQMPLQFAVGARIVGVEFPAKYGGEWAIGWADGVRAPFPAEAVRLDTPATQDVRRRGQGHGQVGGGGGETTMMTAVVRWKFVHKVKGQEWLKLEKGDTISNICWAYPGHWCWSGTNSKGKWGYFPQSHIDSSSLREVKLTGDERSSVSSGEHRKGGVGLLSRVSLKRAGTGSSSETAHASSSSRPTFH